MRGDDACEVLRHMVLVFKMKYVSWTSVANGNSLGPEKDIY